MNGDVLFGNSESLNGRATYAIRILVKVVFAEDDLVEGRRGAVRGRQDVAAVDQRASAGVDGPVCSSCVKKLKRSLKSVLYCIVESLSLPFNRCKRFKLLTSVEFKVSLILMRSCMILLCQTQGCYLPIYVVWVALKDNLLWPGPTSPVCHCRSAILRNLVDKQTFDTKNAILFLP